MATTWPTLPGASPEIDWEPVETNSEFDADDGSAVVTNRGTTRQRITYFYSSLRKGVAAPAPLAAYDEPQAIRKLIMDASVRSGQFTIPDPMKDADTLTVRIAETPRMHRKEHGQSWTAQIVFVIDP